MRLLGRSVIGRPSLFAGDPRFRIGELGASGAATGIERRIEIAVGTPVLRDDTNSALDTNQLAATSIACGLHQTIRPVAAAPRLTRLIAENRTTATASSQ